LKESEFLEEEETTMTKAVSEVGPLGGSIILHVECMVEIEIRT